MRVKRPSVSMTGIVYRHMAWAADLAGASRSGWVSEAIREKLARDSIPPPHRDWVPEHRDGRPSIQDIERSAEQHFTF